MPRKRLLFCIVLSVLLCSPLVVSLVGVPKAYNPDYTMVEYLVSDSATIDGKWTTSEEWNHGPAITMSNNASFSYVVDTSVSGYRPGWIVEFFGDNTNDGGDFWQICLDPNLSGGTAPDTGDFKIEITGHSTLKLYQGNGIDWTEISAPDEFTWSNSISASPRSSTPHWILEIRENSMFEGAIQRDPPPYGTRIAAYDASSDILAAWAPNSNANIPEEWGLVEKWVTISTPEPTPTGLPTPHTDPDYTMTEYFAPESPVIDGKWTTSEEWIYGPEITMSNNAAFTYFMDPLVAYRPSWIVEFFGDNTNDGGDFWQICYDIGADGGTAPDTGDFKIEITGHSTLKLYQGNGIDWTEISAPDEFTWSNSISASPRSSTPHWILEIRENSMVEGIIQRGPPPFGMRVAAYDASSDILAAWAPNSNANIPEEWGLVDNYSMPISTPEPRPTGLPTPPPTPEPTINHLPTPIPSPTPSPTFTATPTLAPTPILLPEATLTVSVEKSLTYSGFSAEISGVLSGEGAGIAGEGVLLFVSVTGGASWDTLSYVITDAKGEFTIVWNPSVTGNYLFNATWLGNLEYSATSSLVNFALTPFAEKNVFAVTSNSTLSGLLFDSANSILSFNVTGPAGTTGYVNAIIPKALLGQLSSLKVYLDGSELPFNSVSQADSWAITFTYQHSSHEVSINLSSDASTPSIGEQLWNLLPYILPLTIIVIVIAVAAVRVSRRQLHLAKKGKGVREERW